jgi:DNA polymerase III delta prime subunit
MKRRYWVVSPNVVNDGNVKYWLERSLNEQKVFVGYDNDSIHGSKFDNTLSINDIIIISHGAKDSRTLYMAGVIKSHRQFDTINQVYFRDVEFYLNKSDFKSNNIILDSNNAYKESSNPGTIYELKLSNSFDKKVIDNISLVIKQKKISRKMQDKIDLLEYKKQIILQGPPGTGKTRLAKEIAKVLIGETIIKKKPLKISNSDIEKYLSVGLEIPSVQEKSLYTITEITPNNIRLTLTTGKTYSPNFSDIKNWYDNKKWAIKGEQSNQLDPYNAALAKYIHDNIEDIEIKSNTQESDQYKIIQFHPSYTYEDFVRGIVSVPNEDGEGVLFKTENKILAEFAEKALKNKLDSQKGAVELSKEKWLNEQFEKFIYAVSEILEVKEKIKLTKAVEIIEIDEDAFRYKGLKGWSKKGNRMLFKDIKQAYLDENFERQDLKHNHNLSGLAKWHASYYIRVLDMFKNYLKENEINFIASTTEKEELKNYVLIIDEINRANLPSVLGELIYALEYRDEPVESMYEYEGKRKIVLPDNLYIIGTMNTADRSVGHIDYAIKRRFAFVDILPTDQAIDDVVVDPGLNAKAKSLYHKVAELFNEDKSKTVYLQSDFKAKDVQLGHSYFLVETEKQLELKLEFEIKPLLNEYVKDGILSEEALLEIANL